MYKGFVIANVILWYLLAITLIEIDDTSTRNAIGWILTSISVPLLIILFFNSLDEIVRVFSVLGSGITSLINGIYDFVMLVIKSVYSLVVYPLEQKYKSREENYKQVIRRQQEEIALLLGSESPENVIRIKDESGLYEVRGPIVSGEKEPVGEFLVGDKVGDIVNHEVLSSPRSVDEIVRYEHGETMADMLEDGWFVDYPHRPITTYDATEQTTSYQSVIPNRAKKRRNGG